MQFSSLGCIAERVTRYGPPNSNKTPASVRTHRAGQNNQQKEKFVTNDIITLATPGDDGEPMTTSLIVANGTEVEHASVIKLIRNNIADFEESAA